MIKKLQKRFVIITMSLISVVLIVVFSSLILSLANRMQQDSFRNLDETYMRVHEPERVDISDNLKDLPDNKQDKPFGEHSPFSTFFVTLDSTNTVTDIVDSKGDLNEATASQAVKEVLNQEHLEGVIQSLNLRYKIFEHSEGSKEIGFIDISFEKSFVGQQILNYCLIGSGALIAFFFISLVLSGMAIRPVKKAWMQQQQFVADASHELKTPITVMLANTSILLSNKASYKSKDLKWILNIDTEAKHMKKLVEDLLFLARIDSQEKSKLHSRIDLSNTLYESVLPIEALMFEKNRKLKIDILPHIFINGDAGQIKQLVCILLDNASKYSYEDTTVTVTLRKENNKALLTVHNLSEPISKHNQQIIFDRFIRIDEARTRDQESYGLGLAIAKEIVLAHNGNIIVSSSKEKGTTFTIALPI